MIGNRTRRLIHRSCVFLASSLPKIDERDRFAEICRRFEAKEFEGLAITLKEAAFMKLFCDAYFLTKIRNKAINAKLAKTNSD